MDVSALHASKAARQKKARDQQHQPPEKIPLQRLCKRNHGKAKHNQNNCQNSHSNLSKMHFYKDHFTTTLKIFQQTVQSNRFFCNFFTIFVISLDIGISVSYNQFKCALQSRKGHANIVHTEGIPYAWKNRHGHR